MKRSYLSVSLKRAAVLSAFLLVVVLRSDAESQTLQPFTLEPSQPVERMLESAETHVFQTKLRAGQFLHVKVEQQAGFDVIVSLYGPDGKLLVDVNASGGLLWREAASCIAERKGIYKIEVKPVSQSAPAGRYKIVMSKLRKPDELDRKRVAAERAFCEGHKIYLQPGNNAAAAIKSYDMATDLWSQAADKNWQAVALMNSGWAYQDLSQNDEAITSFNRALSLFREFKDRIGEGKALNALGVSFQRTKQFDKARASYEESLAIRRESRDRRGEGNTLGNMAAMLQDSGQLAAALARFEEVLVIRKELKDRANEADALQKIAFIYVALRNFEKARETLEAALQISRELGDQWVESFILVSLGGFYNFNVPDNVKARSYFEQGLSASRNAKKRVLEALSQIGLGMVCQNLKQYSEAVGLFEKGLAIAREEKEPACESLALSCLGSAHTGLNELERARDYYLDYFNLARERKDPGTEGLALNCLGNVHSNLSQYEKSREYYQQAQQILSRIADHANETLSLTGLGLASFNLNQFEQARGYFDRGLSMARMTKNRLNENVALLGLGSAYEKLNQYKQAEACYEQALVINRDLKDRRGEANLYQNLGNIYTELGNYEKAEEFHRRALVTFQEIKDRNGESNSLINLGNVCYYLAHYEKAKESYGRALAIKLEGNEKQGKDVALNNLGAVSNDLNQYDKAKDFFDQAAVVSREIRNRVTEGLITRNVGSVYFSDRNQYEKAKRSYEQALATSREIKDQKGEGGALDALGTVARNLGQFEASRDNYAQALSIFREIKNRRAEAAVLNDLGVLYNELSQLDKARDYFEQALVLRQELKDRRGEADTLNSLGLIDKSSHAYEKAAEHFSKALAIFLDIKIRRGEADSLSNLGDVENRLNHNQRAREELDRALTIFREIRDRRSEGNALDTLATVYQSLKQYQKAEELYRLALTIFRDIKDKQDEGKTLNHLMQNCKLNRQSRMAIFYGKQAINAFQDIRGSLKRFEKETKESFLKDKESAYRMLADTLIESGRLAEAEQVLALLKEEEFSGLIRRSDKEKSTISYSATEKDAEKIQIQLAEIGRERSELVALSDKLDEPGKQRLLTIDRDLIPKTNAAFARALEAIGTAVLSGDRGLKKRIIRHSVVISEVENETLMPHLRALGPGTVALYTVLLGKDEVINKGWIFLVTPDFRKAYSINVINLNQTIVDLRRNLSSLAGDPQSKAHELYRKLFLNPQIKGPTLAEDLQTYLRNKKDKTLMWSLDGVLRYVPMAALYDGEKYLVERYRNVVFTSASPALTAPVSRKWRALGLAISKPYPGFVTLSSTPLEMAAIIRDQANNTTGVLPGRVKFNDQFTEETMMNGLREGYQVLHIATHFVFDEADPQHSYLLLGDGNHLKTSNFKDSASIFENLELVTLSACDTAMIAHAGGKDSEGFAFAAQKLGAKAVIASLWKVDDAGTQLLMPEFYRLRETDRSKAEALQQAQLAMLRGELRDAKGSQKRHPYYWAPFILIGNFK